MTPRPPRGGGKGRGRPRDDGSSKDRPSKKRGPAKRRGPSRKQDPSKKRAPSKGRGAGQRRGQGKKGGGSRRTPRTTVGRRPSRPVVAVFAKAPLPGRVKTRLSPALRPDEAADLYRALLLDTIDVVESTDARVTVAFTSATDRRALERLLGRRRRLLLQPPGDMGARIEGVLDRLREHGARRALVVGSDCPGLTPERVREAWQALENAPAVLGPALDGGFYLLGLARAETGLLRGIPWSTAAVLESTRARFRDRGLPVHELPPER
ncbi:MAG TPA: TIGR04282 family arsenosugar biosynthesis glycosyltransferase, partial [Gemmatimonadota bacterium]|nr:TIGR04282 family arsenosugar biosynthesis glycosyltransferase [Gemmatimonadota bacterium]